MNRSSASDRVERRRQQLLQRSAELRLRLVREAAVLKPPLAMADRVLAAGRWLVRHPQWPVGLAALLLLRRPRRALSASVALSVRLWRGWRWWRQLAPALAPAMEALKAALHRAVRHSPP